MTLLATKTYTPQDLLDDPALAGFELVNGQLKERAVSETSGAVAVAISTLLRNEAKKTREATVYSSDAGYQCFADPPNTVRFPDVSLIRASRKCEVGTDPGFIQIPADLVVEVVSPGDRIKAVDDKVDEYLKAGFKLIWVVNPYRRHVHVYRRDGSVQLLSEREEITGESALPSFRCKVGEFFDV